jgi:hypothetical protein
MGEDPSGIWSIGKNDVIGAQERLQGSWYLRPLAKQQMHSWALDAMHRIDKPTTQHPLPALGVTHHIDTGSRKMPAQGAQGGQHQQAISQGSGADDKDTFLNVSSLSTYGALHRTPFPQDVSSPTSPLPWSCLTRNNVSSFSQWERMRGQLQRSPRWHTTRYPLS